MPFVYATSSYLPEKVVDNQDLVQFPERYRHVIAEKAGIYTRRHADGECTSDVGARAVARLLKKAGVGPGAVDALICATSSPDRIQPATATRIQELCGIRNGYAFDINSACSGAVYALRLASALVKDGHQWVVVVAAEVYSKIMNPKDLATYPYFGDGAGAVLVGRSGRYELRDFILYSDGSGADVIQVPARGTMKPFDQVEDEKQLYFTMIGREVYDFACQRGSEVLLHLAATHDVIPDRVIPHQANINVINEIAARSRTPPERMFTNLDRYANTGGASVLIALDESSALHPTDRHIFLTVFGGGLSWGGAYLKAA